MVVETETGRRIAVLYASGAGGTALVAKLLEELLVADGLEVSRESVHASEALRVARESDFIVFCYPTYYLRPSPSAREFMERLGPFASPRPAYLVATYELYTENSIRTCARTLKSRGVSVVGSATVRAPGSDVTCVLPGRFLPELYRFEKGFPRKLLDIAGEIRAFSEKTRPGEHIPAPKWYTPFAQALQALALNRFDGYRTRLRVLPERCSRCGGCVSLCPRGAWVMTGAGPSHSPELCELCTRCVHRCPQRAIVLVERLKDNPRLDGSLYAALEADARKRLAQMTADSHKRSLASAKNPEGTGKR